MAPQGGWFALVNLTLASKRARADNLVSMARARSASRVCRVGQHVHVSARSLNRGLVVRSYSEGCFGLRGLLAR